MQKNIIISVLLLSLTACATILQPGPDRIPLRSEPPGGKVLLNGMPVGTTPMELSVHRADNCSIEIQKDGYQTVAIDKHKVVAGWVFGNVLIGGIIGLGVDLITHNQGKYSEDPIFVTMNPVAGTKTAAAAPKATAPKKAAKKAAE